MKTQPKIVIIGAGSASFGPVILADILLCGDLHGCTVGLCDINTQGLEHMTHLAERMNHEWDCGMRLEASSDRRNLLSNADFVIVSIAVDREKYWKLDWEIPAQYGFRQPLGENGGPGAFFHTARNLPKVLAICNDMHDLCPQAVLLNLTNPVPRMTLAATRYSNIKTVGICHQIGFGYAVVALTLADELGLPIQVPDSEWDIYEVAKPYFTKIHDMIDIKAAGINHFTFMQSIQHRETGEDLYPGFIEKLGRMPDSFQPYSRRFYETFKVYPANGDTHISEYTHWASDPVTKPWEKYHLELYDWEGHANERDQMWEQITRMVDGADLDPRLRDGSGEAVVPVITSIWKDTNHYEVALNLPNRGQIQNLPRGAIVETPAVISRDDIRGLAMGDLPDPVAALCRTQLSVASLAVDAAYEGDRDLALQALMLDPMVTDFDNAKQMLDEMLKLQKEQLPRFWG